MVRTQPPRDRNDVPVNAAARVEKFSDDGVGHTTVPRLGLRWQPVPEQITFRASWGKGFRAPALAELYLPQTVAVSFNIPDPLRFGKPGANVNDSGTGRPATPSAVTGTAMSVPSPVI